MTVVMSPAPTLQGTRFSFCNVNGRKPRILTPKGRVEGLQPPFWEDSELV